MPAQLWKKLQWHPPTSCLSFTPWWYVSYFIYLSGTPFEKQTFTSRKKGSIKNNLVSSVKQRTILPPFQLPRLTPQAKYIFCLKSLNSTSRRGFWQKKYFPVETTWATFNADKGSKFEAEQQKATIFTPEHLPYNIIRLWMNLVARLTWNGKWVVEMFPEQFACDYT
jgi:hypothetical protein